MQSDALDYPARPQWCYLPWGLFGEHMGDLDWNATGLTVLVRLLSLAKQLMGPARLGPTVMAARIGSSRTATFPSLLPFSRGEPSTLGVFDFVLPVSAIPRGSW